MSRLGFAPPGSAPPRRDLMKQHSYICTSHWGSCRQVPNGVRGPQIQVSARGGDAESGMVPQCRFSDHWKARGVQLRADRFSAKTWPTDGPRYEFVIGDAPFATIAGASSGWHLQLFGFSRHDSGLFLHHATPVKGGNRFDPALVVLKTGTHHDDGANVVFGGGAYSFGIADRCFTPEDACGFEILIEPPPLEQWNPKLWYVETGFTAISDSEVHALHQVRAVKQRRLPKSSMVCVPQPEPLLPVLSGHYHTPRTRRHVHLWRAAAVTAATTAARDEEPAHGGGGEAVL